MQFRLQINLDNAAFAPTPNLELEQLLRDLSFRIGESAQVPEIDRQNPIRDSNGNFVGYYEVVE